MIYVIFALFPPWLGKSLKDRAEISHESLMKWCAPMKTGLHPSILPTGCFVQRLSFETLPFPFPPTFPFSLLLPFHPLPCHSPPFLLPLPPSLPLSLPLPLPSSPLSSPSPHSHFWILESLDWFKSHLLQLEFSNICSDQMTSFILYSVKCIMMIWLHCLFLQRRAFNNTFEMFLSKRKMNQPSITFAVIYFIKINCAVYKHFFINTT